MSLRGIYQDVKKTTGIKGLLVFAGAFAFAVVVISWRIYKFYNPPEVFTRERVSAVKELVALRQQIEELDERLEAKSVLDKSFVDARPVVVKPTYETRQSSRPVLRGVQTERGFRPLQGAQTLDYIPTGAVFRARLLTPIKTSVQESFVLAETTNEYRMDKVRRIERGSRLVGSAQLNPVLKGVIVRFSRLVTPAGREKPIAALGLSENALPELDGLYVSDAAERYGTILAFGFLGGFADAARTTRTTPFGTFEERNLSNQTLAGVSSASFRVAEEIIREFQDRAVEYVVVPSGIGFFVALTQQFSVKDEVVSVPK